MSCNKSKQMPTRTGVAQGDATERQMVAQLDTEDFRTAQRINPDGSVTRVRTRGGWVHYETQESENSHVPPSKIVKRGFGATVFSLFGVTRSKQFSTLIQWAQAAWGRVSQKSAYAQATGYSVIAGKVHEGAIRKPLDTLSISHIEAEYDDVAHVHNPDNSNIKVLAVNTTVVRDLPNGLRRGYPYIIPVPHVNSGKNTYPFSMYDESSCHVFVVDVSGIDYLANDAKAIKVTQDTTGGYSFPPLATLAGNSAEVRSGGIDFWQTAYTESGGNYTNVYYRRLRMVLTGTPPYINKITPTGVARQAYIYVSMADGAATPYSSSSTWTNGFDVPDLPMFDIFTPTVTSATNGDPGYYNMYLTYAGTSSSPSTPGEGSASTHGFTNSKSWVENYPLGDNLALTVTTSINLEYELISGSGRMRVNYTGGAPNYEVYNVGTGIWGASPGQDPTGDGAIGNYTIVSAEGVKTDCTNAAATIAVYQVGSDVLFSFSSSLNYTYQYRNGWAATGRGMIGRSYMDGLMFAENNSWVSAPGNATRHLLFASGGTIPLQNPDVEYGGSSIVDPSARLITQIINDTAFSVVRTSTCTSRDYIFHDRNNAVAVYLEGRFDATNTSLSVDGQTDITVDIVVEFDDSVFRKTLYQATQNYGCLVGVEETDYVYNAEHDPTHPLRPIIGAIYQPKCAQGEFAHISYSTSGENISGLPKRLLFSIPLFITKKGQTEDTWPNGWENAYIFTPYNLDSAAKCFGVGNGLSDGVFGALATKVHMIYASHEGFVDWLVKINSIGDSTNRFAECFRT